ncbi:MAG: hypothetical protein ACTSRG_16845 [Candidatus Helarchaeota archaeon]
MSRNNFEIQEKLQKIENVKQKFEKEVFKKIGEVLIHEIGKYIDNGNNKDTFNQYYPISVPVPNFLKFMFNLFNKEYLLNDTVFLYILSNFNNLPQELETKYNNNLQEMQKILQESSEIKSLVILNSENSDDSIFLYEFRIPNEFSSIFNQFGENTSNLIIYGVLAITKWLGLLSSKYQPVHKKYEEKFKKYTNYPNF